MLRKLHNSSHLLLTYLQLFLGLLFYPAIWRAYLQRIDPALPLDFALTNVPTSSKHHPELQRLRDIIGVVQPLSVGILVSLILALSGKPVAHLLLGTSYGMVLCAIIGSLSSFTISVAFSLVAGTLGGILIGLIHGLAETTRNPHAIPLSYFILAVAGSVTATLQVPPIPKTWRWQIGGVLIALSVTAMVMSLSAGLGWAVIQWLPISPKSIIYAQTFAMIVVVGLAESMAIGLIFNWNFKGLRLGILFGLAFAVVMGLLISTIFLIVQQTGIPWLKGLLRGITGGAVNGLAFAILFTLPYLLARHVASAWAGMVAGILGSSGVYLGVTIYMVESSQHFTLLIGSVLCFILGVSMIWWRSLLLYPFEMAWNLLLYLAQQRQPHRTVELLRRHSAFWDQHQTLPLWGLDSQLVMAYCWKPSETIDAMIQLNDTPQAWAVQVAQIKLDTQRLQECQTVSDISELHLALLTSDKLTGATGDWLQNCRQSSRNVETALAYQSTFHQRLGLKDVINFLAGVLAGARDNTENIQQFRDITHHWQTIIQQYADNLLNQMPDIPNPYIVGIPLRIARDGKDNNLFVGRTNLSQQIEQLTLAPQCPPILLYGQRRTGKTSLLLHLSRLLPSNVIPLFVDCQGPVASSMNEASLFYNLGRAIRVDLNQHHPQFTLPPLELDKFREDPFTHFDEWLDQVETVTGDNLLLLALDEFVVLQESFVKGRFQPATVLGMFRHIIQHRQRFRLLFAGTHTLDELRDWANYFINVQTIHISYLKDVEAYQLIEQPLKDFPLRYPPEVRQRVIDLTRCHPALLQLLCNALVHLKNNQKDAQRFTAQVDDVEAAILEVFKTGIFFFTEIEFNQVTETGKRVLRLIASHGDGALVSKDTLQAQFPTELAETLALLLRRELIETVDHSYRFQVEIVRQWFAQSHG
jgi:hypothetical protein